MDRTRRRCTLTIGLAPLALLVPDAKEPVSVLLDPEVVAFFREAGGDWEARMNDVLAEHVRRKRAP